MECYLLTRYKIKYSYIWNYFCTSVQLTNSFYTFGSVTLILISSSRRIRLQFSLNHHSFSATVSSSCEYIFCSLIYFLATIYCIVESHYLCVLCGLNCLRENHLTQPIIEQLVVTSPCKFTLIIFMFDHSPPITVVYL